MAQRQLSPAGPRLQSGVRSQLYCAGRPDKRNELTIIDFVPEATTCAPSINFGMHTILAVFGVGRQVMVLAEHLLVSRHLHDPALVCEHLPEALVDRYAHLASNTIDPVRQMRPLSAASDCASDASECVSLSVH